MTAVKPSALLCRRWMSWATTWRIQDMGADDPKIIDGKYFLPQHRERIVLVGFRRDLNLKGDFTLRDIPSLYPARRPSVADLLEPAVDAKFILTPVLWKYLYRYAKSIRQKATVLVLAGQRTIRTVSPAPCPRAITKTVRRSDRSWLGQSAGRERL